MHRRSIFTLALAAPVLCGNDCHDPFPTPEGRVEVSVYDVLGERFSKPEIELIDANGKSQKALFENGSTAMVPYGNYTLGLRSAGFYSHERLLRVEQPDVQVRAVLRVGMGCIPQRTFSGKVHPEPGKRELWVKVVPVMGIRGGEGRVGADGSFHVAGMDGESACLLLVLDGNRLVHSQTLDERSGGENLRVDLAGM